MAVAGRGDKDAAGAHRRGGTLHLVTAVAM